MLEDKNEKADEVSASRKDGACLDSRVPVCADCPYKDQNAKGEGYPLRNGNAPLTSVHDYRNER